MELGGLVPGALGPLDSSIARWTARPTRFASSRSRTTPARKTSAARSGASRARRTPTAAARRRRSTASAPPTTRWPLTWRARGGAGGRRARRRPRRLHRPVSSTGGSSRPASSGSGGRAMGAGRSSTTSTVGPRRGVQERPHHPAGRAGSGSARPRRCRRSACGRSRSTPTGSAACSAPTRAREVVRLGMLAEDPGGVSRS